MKYFLLFLLLLPCVVAESSTVFVNDSDLPLVDYVFVLNVSVENDSLVFVEELSNSSFLFVNYSSNASGSGSVLLNFSVSTIGLRGFNESVLLNASFNISSNSSGLSSVYSIFVNYSSNFSNPFINVSPVFFVVVLNGDFLVNVSTDLLPKTGRLKYVLAGNKGEKLYVSCMSGWISCPLTSVFDGNNETEFFVDYSIPSSAGVGLHVYNISFRMGNITLKKKIKFLVRIPDLNILEYKFRDECFKQTGDGSLAVSFDCVEEQALHNADVVSEYLDLIKDSYEYCEPEIINKTEFVSVNSLDDELKKNYDDCLVNKRDCDTKLSVAQASVNQYQLDFGVCQKTLVDEEVAYVNKINNASKTIAEEGKRERRKTFWMIFWIFSFVGFIYFIRKWFNKTKKESVATW